MIIRCKINLAKLREDKIFKGAKGDYIDISILDNRNGPDEYGNDVMVTQDLGKESREAGEKNPILGNGKYIVRPNGAAASPRPAGTEPVQGSRYSTRIGQPMPAPRTQTATVMKEPAPAAKQQELDEDVPF